MINKEMPLDGLIILKRLNTKESEFGILVENTEYVFASKKYPEIVRKLASFPMNHLSWLIVAKFKQNINGEIVYSDGISGLDFLKNAQNYLYKQVTLN